MLTDIQTEAGELRAALESLVSAYVTVPSGGPTVSQMIACVTDAQHVAWMRAWTLVAPPEDVDAAWRGWVDEAITAGDLERLMTEAPPANDGQARYAMDRFGAIERERAAFNAP